MRMTASARAAPPARTAEAAINTRCLAQTRSRGHQEFAVTVGASRDANPQELQARSRRQRSWHHTRDPRRLRARRPGRGIRGSTDAAGAPDGGVIRRPADDAKARMSGGWRVPSGQRRRCARPTARSPARARCLVEAAEDPASPARRRARAEAGPAGSDGGAWRSVRDCRTGHWPSRWGRRGEGDAGAVTVRKGVSHRETGCRATTIAGRDGRDDQGKGDRGTVGIRTSGARRRRQGRSRADGGRKNEDHNCGDPPPPGNESSLRGLDTSGRREREQG